MAAISNRTANIANCCSGRPDCTGDVTDVGHVLGADDVDVVEPGDPRRHHRTLGIQRQREGPGALRQRAVDLVVVEQGGLAIGVGLRAKPRAQRHDAHRPGRRRRPPGARSAA